jgi:hypothetical protein
MRNDWDAVFAKYIKLDPKTGCHNWTGGKSRGYGWVALGEGKGGRTTGAHRAAYLHFVGPIPAGLQIRHMCHNKACCNPAHLKVGTALENRNDSVEYRSQVLS